MSGWRPVLSAPRDASRILVARRGEEPWIAHWSESENSLDGGYWVDDDIECARYGHEPTHWQPLPEPPT